MARDPSWTIRKGQPEGTWGDWLFAHAVLLIMGALVGAALGWFAPLIAASAPGGRGATRAALRAADGVTHDSLVHGTNEGARGRAVIGGVLGVLGAVGIAVPSRRTTRAGIRRPDGGAAPR